jgi:hypothetical protein
MNSGTNVPGFTNFEKNIFVMREMHGSMWTVVDCDQFSSVGYVDHLGPWSVRSREEHASKKKEH